MRVLSSFISASTYVFILVYVKSRNTLIASWVDQTYGTGVYGYSHYFNIDVGMKD